MAATGSLSPASAISSASCLTLDLRARPHSAISRQITVLLFLAKATTSGESPGDVQRKDLCLDFSRRSMSSRTCFLTALIIRQPEKTIIDCTWYNRFSPTLTALGATPSLIEFSASFAFDGTVVR